MWISAEGGVWGGVSADMDKFNFKFYDIIIKCRNVDKERGGGPPHIGPSHGFSRI